MTARESAWNGGPSDPPTAPLPAVDYWGNVSPNYFAPFDWQPPSTYQPPQVFQVPRTRRRGRRLLRRATILVVVIVALAVLAFGVLLLVTPSVTNATALAQAQAQAHHSVYPG